MEQNPNIYVITYTNSFIFENILLAFRKKELFNISTNTPIFIPYNEKCRCWIVNRKQLTLSKVKKLITKKEVSIDVSHLQWTQQIYFNLIFNL